MSEQPTPLNKRAQGKKNDERALYFVGRCGYASAKMLGLFVYPDHSEKDRTSLAVRLVRRLVERKLLLKRKNEHTGNGVFFYVLSTAGARIANELDTRFTITPGTDFTGGGLLHHEKLVAELIKEGDDFATREVLYRAIEQRIKAEGVFKSIPDYVKAATAGRSEPVLKSAYFRRGLASVSGISFKAPDLNDFIAYFYVKNTRGSVMRIFARTVEDLGKKQREIRLICVNDIKKETAIRELKPLIAKEKVKRPIFL